VTDSDRCVVWWASLDARRDWHARLLDERERSRASQYRRPADQSRSVLAAALLRLAAGERLGIAADRVAIDRTCPDCERPHGRPRLPDSGLHVSVAHSGDLVAVALTGVAPVGVDVEQVIDIDFSALAKSVLDSDETAGLLSIRNFFVYWTRKESALKATGDGLTVPMNRVRVSAPDEPAALLRYPSRQRNRPVVARMYDLEPGSGSGGGRGDGYVAALTVLTDQPVEVEALDAIKLLDG
jgi:4'-phosphopantetheinyl transferase